MGIRMLKECNPINMQILQINFKKQIIHPLIICLNQIIINIQMANYNQLQIILEALFQREISVTVLRMSCHKKKMFNSTGNFNNNGYKPMNNGYNNSKTPPPPPPSHPPPSSFTTSSPQSIKDKKHKKRKGKKHHSKSHKERPNSNGFHQSKSIMHINHCQIVHQMDIIQTSMAIIHSHHKDKDQSIVTIQWLIQTLLLLQ